MGMFDYFTIDTSLLPMVPSELKVKENGTFTFQTKDTATQGMVNYIQERDCKLSLEKKDGYWKEGPPANENASFSDRIASLGEYVYTDTWYEDQYFRGIITFYTHLRHSEDDGSGRYVHGWIEYAAGYRNGFIEEIVVDQYTPPKVLTDKELAERDAAAEAARTAAYNRSVERRMTSPTNSERLIDQISDLVAAKESLYDETDLVRVINNIQQLIEEYREKHDPYYKLPN